MAQGTFNAWINPLAFLPLDQPGPTDSGTPSPQDFLAYMCATGQSADPAELAKRYKEIAKEPVQLFAVPAEQRILDKLIWPLRHAKASYVLGNHVGTIALCGMVAEMVTMLLFDLASVQINGQPMDDKRQEAVFGREFEKLDQSRRVHVLFAYGIIDDTARQNFDLIRTTRRKYLHLWSQDHEALPGDAVKVYHASVSLVARAIGQGVAEGAVALNPALVKYLEKAGIYTPKPEPSSEGAV